MKIYVSKASPLYGKENDLTFGIGQDRWLYVDGDCWPKGKDFWRRIRAQYDVSDIIENGYMLWIRTYEEELRCVTYYSKMDYLEEIDFVRKYPDCRFIDSYGDVTVLVDKEGEFHVLYSNKEVDLKSATYRVSWEFTCKTTKILLLYIFLGHNRNVVNTKFPYPIKRLEVIRRFNQKSMAFNQSLS